MSGEVQLESPPSSYMRLTMPQSMSVNVVPSYLQLEPTKKMQLSVSGPPQVS